jgi:hypothetical protein
LAESGLNITTSANSLGKQLGPGSFTFEAGPGDYFVSLFATASGVSAEEKKQMVEDERQRRGNDWWHSLTAEEQMAQKALWKSWTAAEMQAHQEQVRARAERHVDARLASLDNFGQYGVQIALMAPGVGSIGSGNSAVVPLPASIWLFGAGLAGFAGFARKSIASSC